MGKTTTLTNDEFISRALSVHGAVYDYSDTTYVNSRTRVDIQCKRHGTFSQKVHNHLNGAGCPMCTLNRVFNTESFIDKATSVHGDTYLYHKTNWVNNSSKVTITCRLHGDFEQIPNGHSSGYGCAECADSRKKGRGLKPTEDCIAVAKGVHGDLYDYSEFENNGVFEKTYLTCKTTGDRFSVTPDNHMRGRGCPCCRYSKISEQNKMPYGEVEALLLSKFDGNISSVESTYNTFTKPCTLVCTKHGEFVKIPQSIINTLYACPECSKENVRHSGFYNESYVSRNADEFRKSRNNLYIFSMGGKAYKVGMAKNVKARLNDVNNDSGLDCKLVWSGTNSTYNCFYLEQYFHELFARHRVDLGIDFPGKTEVFNINDEHITFVLDFFNTFTARGVDIDPIDF